MKRILIFCAGLICTSLAVAGDWESVYPGPKAAPRVVETPKVDPVVTTDSMPAAMPAAMPTTVITTKPTTKVDAKPTIRVVGTPSMKPAAPIVTTGDAYPAVTVPDVNQMPLPTVVQSPSQSQPQVPLTITPKSTYKYLDVPAFQPKPPVITSGDTVSVYPGTAVPVTAPVPSGTTVIAVPPVATTSMPVSTSGTTIPLFGVPTAAAKPVSSVSSVSSVPVTSIPVSTPVSSVIPTPSLSTYLTPHKVSTTNAVDLSQPLPNILTAPLPTSPTIAALPQATAGVCATGTCTTGTCATCDAGGVPCGTPLLQPLLGRGSLLGGNQAALNGERPTLDRLKAWLCYQPGPSVWPGFTPTPYSAPIRAYFPASESRCATGTNCGAGQAGNANCAGGQLQPAATTGCTGSACRAPIAKGFGLFAHPSSTYATTGPIGVACTPVAVPLPPSCVGSAAPLPCSPRSGYSTFDRLLGFFAIGGCTEKKAWTCPTTNCQNPGQNCAYTTANVAPPTATVPVIMGYTQPSSGYRFANPIAVPTQNTAQNAVPQQNIAPVQQGVTAPTAPQVLPASAQMSANRPFSNP